MPATTVGRLLLADDETELMETLRGTLTEQRYEVSAFTSGLEAMKAIQEREFDLLLSDLTMPDVDGISLLKAGLAVDPNLVGVIMTGHGTIETAIEALKMGAFDYILKPFKMRELTPLLSRAMEFRRLKCENVQLAGTVAVYELSMAIAFVSDADAILGKAADAALQQCEADEASIMLPSPEEGVLYVAVVRGGHKEHILGARVPIGQGISGWVARTLEPVLLHGGNTDAGFAPVAPRSDIKSSISVPMLAGGVFVGVLNVSATKNRRFTVGQVKSLSILASTVASALQAQESDRRYRSIFDNAVEGIFQSTPDRGFTMVNPALAAMLGYESPDDLIAGVKDMGRQAYVDPSRRSEFIDLIERQGSVSLFESEVYRKDGSTRWVSENARAVRDGSGKLLHYEGFVDDITERKQLREEFLQAQKMEVVGRLAGGVAHDFNNILTVILSAAGFALADLPCEHPTRKDLRDIQEAARRAAGLTRQLLTFARRQKTEPRLVDVNELLRGLEKMIRRLIGEDVVLAMKLAADPGMVWADPGQLEQLVVNLAVNARDAMPSGGTLTIEMRKDALDGSQSSQLAAPGPPEHTRIAVRDTGTGMTEEVKAHIFEPFFTTKEVGKGTGLGLATCYGIVQECGGRIDVESAPGEGSVFYVYLPRAIEQSDQKVLPPTFAEESMRGTETILLVEDEEAVRAVAAGALRREGYCVIEAATGQEALQLAETHAPPDIRLLLSDMVMPGMSGVETACRLRDVQPDVKVLFVSGYSENSVTSACASVHDAAFLQKPYSPETLARKVREVLG